MSIFKIRAGISSAMIHDYCGQVTDKHTGREKCTHFENDLGIRSPDILQKAWEAEREGHGKVHGRQYYHSVYSLDPNDPKAKTLTDKELAAMGRELAEKMAPGHSHALYVHRDQEHPHIHIVWSAIHRETGKKYHMTPKDLEKAHALVAEIDRKHELAPLQKRDIPREVGHSWEAKRLLQRKPDAYIWMDHLANIIRTAQNTAKNFEDFKRDLKKKGVDVDVKPDKKITYSFNDKDNKQHKARHTKLGDNYSYERINKTIEGRIRDNELKRRILERDREIERQHTNPDISHPRHPGRVPTKSPNLDSNSGNISSRVPSETTRNRKETEHDSRRSKPTENTDRSPQFDGVPIKPHKQGVPIDAGNEHDIAQADGRSFRPTHADASDTQAAQRTPTSHDRRPSEPQSREQTVPHSDDTGQRIAVKHATIHSENRDLSKRSVQGTQERPIGDSGTSRQVTGQDHKPNGQSRDEYASELPIPTRSHVKGDDVAVGSGISSDIYAAGPIRNTQDLVDRDHPVRENSQRRTILCSATGATESEVVKEIAKAKEQTTPRAELERQVNEWKEHRSIEQRRGTVSRRVSDPRTEDDSRADTYYCKLKERLLHYYEHCRRRLDEASSRVASIIQSIGNKVSAIEQQSEKLERQRRVTQEIEERKRIEIEAKQKIEMKRKRSPSIGR